jgi:hypothetical protein
MSLNRWRWIVPAAVLAILAVVVAVIIINRRGTTPPPPPLTGAAAWFTAASGPTCVGAPKADKAVGTVAAVRCTAPGVVAIFRELANAADVTAYIAVLRRTYPRSTVSEWIGDKPDERGERIDFGTGRGIAWTYSTGLYMGEATSTSSVVLVNWWIQTGRVTVN